MCVIDTLIICYSCQAHVSPIFYATAAKHLSALSFMLQLPSTCQPYLLCYSCQALVSPIFYGSSTI